MKEQLIQEFKKQQLGLNGSRNETFNQARIKALDNFIELGFPNKKHEEWKYSNLKKLVNGNYQFHKSGQLGTKDLASFDIPDLEGIILYFVNGVYNAEMSDLSLAEGKIKIQTLKAAQEDNIELLNAHFSKYSNNSEEAFTALNSALANDGVVVQIDDNVVFEKPIILRMISDVRAENNASVLRNLILVGKNSEVKIAEAYRTMGEKSAFVNTLTEILLEDDAKVDYYKVQNDNDASYHIGTTNVYQKDRTYFYAATITLNGGYVRNNLNLTLDGEYIDSHMYGLYVPNAKQHVDNHTVVDHLKPNSISNELYKGVLMDNATGVFNGKVFVRKEAQKTNAYQNCRNVITSDNAVMNSKPQLEIWADDVKCSHGATTGKLNEEAIFYMQSRGIPKKEAVKLQLLAFAEDVISKIKIETVKDYLAVLIKEKLA